VTREYAADRESSSAQYPMLDERITGVFRACWVVTTMGTKIGAETKLIQPDCTPH